MDLILELPPLRREVRGGPVGSDRCQAGHMMIWDGKRQRCPICQSRYSRKWRKTQKEKQA